MATKKVTKATDDSEDVLAQIEQAQAYEEENAQYLDNADALNPTNRN